MFEERNGVGSMAAVAVIAAITLITGGGILLAVYDSDGSEGYYEYSIDGTFGDGWVLDGTILFEVVRETGDGADVRISMSLDVRSEEGADAGFHFSGVETEFTELDVKWPIERQEIVNTGFGAVEMDIYGHSENGMSAELYISDGVVYKIALDLVPEPDDGSDRPVSIVIELVRSNRV